MTRRPSTGSRGQATNEETVEGGIEPVDNADAGELGHHEDRVPPEVSIKAVTEEKEAVDQPVDEEGITRGGGHEKLNQDTGAETADPNENTIQGEEIGDEGPDIDGPNEHRTDSHADEQPSNEDEIAIKQEQILRTTPIKKKITINLSKHIPAQAGIGPTTTKNLQNGTKTELGPVPQPSPSVFRPFLPPPESTFHAQTEQSIPISQLDPIVDFSSPARSAVNGYGTRAQRQTQSQIMMEDSQVPDGDEVKDELQKSIQPKIVKKIIDGEEVFVAWSESLEDEMAEEGRDGQAGVHVELEPEAQLVWEDDDLALLTSPVS